MPVQSYRSRVKMLIFGAILLLIFMSTSGVLFGSFLLKIGQFGPTRKDSLGDKSYQVEGVVDEIFQDYWILQSEVGVFKFKINSKSQKDLKRVQVGDRVTVIYHAEVIRVFVFPGVDGKPEHRKFPERRKQRENPYKVPMEQLDDRAFYEARLCI